MDAALADGVELALRWLHVIAGIAWIGSSFYFIHLDASLEKRPGLPPGVAGEAWQVHGGGFYRMQKYTIAPPELPEKLTWFKWEAYTTWLSGFLLLLAIYYAKPELYLIDPRILPLEPWRAVVIGLASILLGYLLYEVLCRSPLGRDDRLLALAGVVLVVLFAFAMSRIFSGRGALIQTGAFLGTCMAASVAHVIIPNQRKAVAALLEGRVPDPELGRRAKQRSLHNNYVTLPVVFTMITGHYPLVFDNRWNWLILSLVLVIGFAVRYFFNERHAGRPSPWWSWGVAAAAGLAALWLARPLESAGDGTVTTASDSPPAFAEVEAVLGARCAMCHAERPVWPGLAAPPKGVALDTAEAIRRWAPLLAHQAVHTGAMPPGNLTGLEEEERRLLARWLAAGAPGPAPGSGESG
ncbi:MAG: urate hydroxylase PuuD [Geminicoccaceae bacterium]|nr:urate hydroxylase PuuD [Geminicoccaceae bacterium]